MNFLCIIATPTHSCAVYGSLYATTAEMTQRNYFYYSYRADSSSPSLSRRSGPQNRCPKQTSWFERTRGWFKRLPNPTWPQWRSFSSAFKLDLPVIPSSGKSTTVTSVTQTRNPGLFNPFLSLSHFPISARNCGLHLLLSLRSSL